jgi:hypothetical protein
MGATGKSLHGHGKRRTSTSPAASVSDGGYGLPPHPIRIRSGQKFWPRHSPGRRRRALVVQAVNASVVRARRVDEAREHVTITVARLERTRADGQGEHYQFIAWSPRRYRTWATVVTNSDAQVTLVLPEWHPARPVHLPVRLLPEAARFAGAWIEIKANLSAPSAGRLNLGEFRECADPGPARCPRPVWAPAR